MPPHEQSAFLDRYARLYDSFWFDTSTAEAVAETQDRQSPRARGELGHRLAGIPRLLNL